MRPGPLNRKLATFRSNSCILNLARHQAPPQLVRPRMCRSFLFRFRVKILKYLILAFLPWRGFRAQRGETLQPVRIGRKLAPQLGRSIYLFRSCPVPSRTADENAGADVSTMSFAGQSLTLLASCVPCNYRTGMVACRCSRKGWV